MDEFVIHLRAWLCLVVSAAALAAVGWYEGRRRKPDDARGWKPTEATIVERSVVLSNSDSVMRLVVQFRTWRGHTAVFVADVPTAEAPVGNRVWALYDPLRPERVQLVLHQPDEY